ncbi:MAG: hypothetical protein HZB26_07785 [Candidatus Hydrogenedentes bacterium]|nr:hypothetical protein [Candidatus Hydrogenedentota bacterium]
MVISMLLAVALSARSTDRADQQPLVIGVVLHTGIWKTDFGLPGATGETYEDFVLFPLAVSEKKTLKPFFPSGEWDQNLSKMADVEAFLSDRTTSIVNRMLYGVGDKGRVFCPQNLVRCCGSLGTSVYGYRGRWNDGATPNRPTIVSTRPIRSLVTTGKTDTGGVLALSAEAIRKMEPGYKDTYLAKDYGFDPTLEGAPTQTLSQNLRAIRGKRARWIEITKPYKRKPDAECTFSALYQGLFCRNRAGWSPYWEQAILLQNDGPLYEERYTLLGACDANNDNTPEFVFQTNTCESSSLVIKELRDGKLVELASLYGPFWWD